MTWSLQMDFYFVKKKKEKPGKGVDFAALFLCLTSCLLLCSLARLPSRPQSRVESRFWDASKICCSTSGGILSDACDCRYQPARTRCRRAVNSSC